MMKAFRAYKYVIENFGIETAKQLSAQVWEEIRNLPLTSDDDALDPDVARVLRTHGCNIENHTEFQRVIFPQGTTRDQYLVTSVPYCFLTLPSGLQVKEIGKPNRKYCCLYIFDEANNAGYPNITY